MLYPSGWHGAQQRGHRGHEDRPKPQHAGPIDRVLAHSDGKVALDRN
jgi:hypothetical protein